MLSLQLAAEGGNGNVAGAVDDLLGEVHQSIASRFARLAVDLRDGFGMPWGSCAVGDGLAKAWNVVENAGKFELVLRARAALAGGASTPRGKASLTA